jgi:hypothetical protein
MPEDDLILSTEEIELDEDLSGGDVDDEGTNDSDSEDLGDDDLDDM